MARRSRIEINRAALDAITGATADGLFDIARAIVRVAESRAPDAPPYGQGLVEGGGAMVWANGKQVNRTPPEVKKPRGLTIKSQRHSVVAVAGFGFPAMFLELGTVHSSAEPFLSPSVQEVVGDAEVILSKAMSRRLRGERDPKSAGISQRVAAAKAAKAAAL